MSTRRFHAAHSGGPFAPVRPPDPRACRRASAWNALPGLQKMPALFGGAEIILLIEAVNVNDY